MYISQLLLAQGIISADQLEKVTAIQSQQGAGSFTDFPTNAILIWDKRNCMIQSSDCLPVRSMLIAAPDVAKNLVS